jgi:hypothetical protein
MPDASIPADWPSFQQLIDALHQVPPSEYVAMRQAFDAAVKQVWH